MGHASTMVYIQAIGAVMLAVWVLNWGKCIGCWRLNSCGPDQAVIVKAIAPSSVQESVQARTAGFLCSLVAFGPLVNKYEHSKLIHCM